MINDSPYLEHILEAIEKIERYLGETPYNDFVEDSKTLDAVIRELEIIGEAARNLSEDFRGQHPELPYSEMIGMRNRIIHEYFDINTKVVWDTCKISLPQLKEKIVSIVRAK